MKMRIGRNLEMNMNLQMMLSISNLYHNKDLADLGGYARSQLKAVAMFVRSGEVLV